MSEKTDVAYVKWIRKWREKHPDGKLPYGVEQGAEEGWDAAILYMQARIDELEAENNESLELLQKIRADLRMRAEPDPVGEGYLVNLSAGLWVRLKNYTSNGTTARV